MKIEIDHDEVQTLLEDLNRTLFLLEGIESPESYKHIVDSLLEDKSSPIKKLAKILKVEI